MSCLILFGGTFDPIHNGHLSLAKQVFSLIKPDEFKFLPCKRPVLKGASHANTSQRLDMLELAISPFKRFSIDTHEIERETPSYMVDTLFEKRRHSPHDSIHLLVGMDAFLSLPQWHNYTQLLALANLLVVNRPGKPVEVSSKLKELMTGKACDYLEVTQHPHGRIAFLSLKENVTSSTRVRQLLSQKKSVSTHIPASVEHYIKTHRLYET